MLFKQSDADLLDAHLQALMQVELFTIPFYLTAASSISTSAAEGSTALQSLQQEVVSVAVQEMYHLQQASNLCNAFSVDPALEPLSLPAGQEILVPHLDPNNMKFYVKMGNLPDVIAGMIQVEEPDPDPGPVTPNKDVTYRSIADLYAATLELLSEYFTVYGKLPAALDPYFDPGRQQIGYGAFPTRFNYNQILTRVDALHSINAITDQGEGNLVAPENLGLLYGTDGKVREEYQGLESDRFVKWDVYTHFWRFNDVNAQLAKLPSGSFYTGDGTKSPDLPSWAPPLATLQSAMTTIWSFLFDQLAEGLKTGNLPPTNPDPSLPGFNNTMIAFKYLIPMVWQYGVVPSFNYTAGVTGQQAQDAMDQVDPYCLFHWDAKSAGIRAANPDKLNACQGLNLCAGLGWGGVATAAANGACALADTHTCVGSNTCSLQGGCGYFSSNSKGLLPPEEQWIPGANTGAETGGCQTPISPRQVFHDYPDSKFPEGWEDLKPLRNTGVWDRARSLMAMKLNVSSLPTPLSGSSNSVDYDGTKRRAAVTPSSTKS